MPEIIVLNDKDVEDLVSFEDNLRMIERVFGDYNLGKSHAFPVIREEIKKHKGFFGIKSGYLETQDVLGFKAGGFWANNKTKGLAPLCFSSCVLQIRRCEKLAAHGACSNNN